MTTSTQARFRTRILRSVGELVPIESEWHELYLRCPDATPFQSPEWLLPWIEVFSPSELHVIEVREDGRLVALAPLLIYPRGSERVLAFAGGGVSDYLNVLLQPSCGPEMLSRILSAVEGIENWTFLELTDLQGKSNLLSVAGLSAHVYQHDTCSVTLLPDSSEALLREFSDRQRANLRLARSRLQRAGGGEVQIATQETMSQFLDELFALHAIRWSSAGEAGVLCDPRVQRFHRVSAPLLLARGYLRLYRLRVGDRTAAVVYSLFDRTTVFCYLQGFDPQFSFLSPGTLLMFSVMEDVIRLGGHRFDFLRGREGYKQHWRPQVEHTFRITFPRSALCSLPGDSAKAA